MSTWYQACGAKADEENYGQAASLFRALGQAEKIHYSRYSDAIVKATGAMPKIEIAPPTVHDTKENLERAVKDEQYQKDVMMPQYINAARSDKNDSVEKLFSRAREASANHIEILKETLGKLSSLKGSPPMTYIICGTCGIITSKSDLQACPVCSALRKDFTSIK